MSRPQAAPQTLKPIYLETRNLYIRNITVDDATDAWAAWFDQPDVREGLNLDAGGKTKADLVAYIRTFDQVSKILLGIFDKKNDLLVAILSVHVDWRIGRFLANTVVGEAAYRHRGVMLEISEPYRDYFFDTLGLNVMTATALATNKPIIAYLTKTGWTLNQTLKNHARSATDGTAIDLHLYSITRSAWQAWKEANPEQLEAMRNARLH